MKPFSILIAEDDRWYAESLQYHLALNPDYSVSYVESGKELLKKLSDRPDVITLDYSLPDMSGADLFKRIKQECPDTQVIIVSGQEDVKIAVELLKEGAYDYIVKDSDTNDRLWQAVVHIRENRDLKTEVVKLREEVGQNYDFSKTIIGNSTDIKKVFSLLDKAVKTAINVSITGETGTGKEVIAKAIHYNSDRKKKPFVAVNISAIPKELFESELFGHEKGAFTGAITRRIGKFEEAKDGTLFLDEIGEMDPNMQAKMLRVLQERELVRVGGNSTVKVNCRIVSATHRDLQEEVRKGNFRQDLYFRLIGLPIQLPALRERKQDIVLLSKHFIQEFAKANGFTEKSLSADANSKLLGYSFPGNIRELKAIIELAMVMADGAEIEPGHITFHSNPSNELNFEEITLKEYNHKIIQYFLDKYDNNVQKVAKVLDIGKSTIYRMLKEEQATSENE